MKLFGYKKKPEYPKMPAGDFEPVLRCSICTGEQVICARDMQTDELHELMMVRNPGDVEGFCSANDIDISEVRKVY